MWQKRTAEEMAEVERLSRRRWQRRALLAGAGATAYFTCLHRMGWSRRYPSPFVRWQEMPARLLIALPCGIIAGCLFYYFKPGQRRTVICPHYDQVKRDDGVTRCACGEEFVDLKMLKWVD